MHELAITEGIIQAAVPEALKHGAKRVLEIRLKIGELSGVIPECIQYYFDIASKGTIAENAKYKDVREQLPAEYEKMEDSRDTLYASFPMR